MAESLKDVRDKISELEKTRASAYGSLSEQLKSLALAQTSLQTETTKLSTSLSTTKTAGTWGELQLRRVVELAGMVEHCDFTEQESAGDQRPDLVVNLPYGQRIVVDAKAPTDAYREAAEHHRSEGARGQTARARRQGPQPCGRPRPPRPTGSSSSPRRNSSCCSCPATSFSPPRSRRIRRCIDRAIRGRVLPATPSTLVALLKAAAYGWRQESVSKNAEEISDLGRQLYDRIATYLEHFEKVGHGLETATKSYNAAVGSLEGALIPGARKFAELGAKGSKELPEIGPVETTPRDVTKRA